MSGKADFMENLTAKQLRDKIAAGGVASAEVTQALFERIDRHDPTVGAYLSTFKDYSLERARQVDRKIAAGQALGALAGVPIAIKDNM